MSEISQKIRKVIFEKYNDPNLRFTNDEVFVELQKNGIIDKSLTIDDMEKHFDDLCDSGMMRNIAQNFTTQWFKLFDTLEKFQCQSCQGQSYICRSEETVCPACGVAI
jgi:hypothetical protein